MRPDIQWPATVDGQRASIRRFAGDIVDAPWLDEAAQAIAGRRSPCLLQRRLDDGDQGWWILGDENVVGALCGKLVELTQPLDALALIWTWLAIDSRWRAYGYGGASVPLLERAAQRLGATVALTPLPPDNGVALYFWLRLGYTPIRSVSVSAPDLPTGVEPDALWMQRPLDATRLNDSLNHEE